MELRKADEIVGYRVFEMFEECYQYNEDACFIAATSDAAEGFRDDGCTPAAECRINAVCLADLMRDYGCSSGEYAMQRDAFVRFQQVAELNAISFRSEPFDGDDSLLVVEIDGVRRHDDE